MRKSPSPSTGPDKRAQAAIVELIDELLIEGAKTYMAIVREVERTFGAGATSVGAIASRKSRYFKHRASFIRLPRSWHRDHRTIFSQHTPIRPADEVHDLMLAHEKKSGIKAPPFSRVHTLHGRLRLLTASCSGKSVSLNVAATMRAPDEFERNFVVELCAGTSCTRPVPKSGDFCDKCSLQMVA